MAMVVVIAVLVASGCSGGDSAAQPTPSTSPTSSAPATKTSSPTPSATPPMLPAEAKVADPDGAAAFIRHYFAVANYAYETGDVEALHPTRHDGCTACKSLEKTVQDGFADGGHIEGGRIGVGDVVVTPGYADIGLEAKAVLNQSEGALVSASGDVIDRIPAEEQLLIGLLLKYQDGWSIVQWGKPDAPQ